MNDLPENVTSVLIVTIAAVVISLGLLLLALDEDSMHDCAAMCEHHVAIYVLATETTPARCECVVERK